MAENAPQTYATHRKFVPAYHYFASLVLVVNLVWTLSRFARALLGGDFDFGLLMNFLLAAVLIVILAYLRLFPLAVQDRVIRLEMKLRLHEVLPDDLRGRLDELSRGQLVALRFAGDAELPDLVRDVLDNQLTDQNAIKKKIKDWQPDDWRC